MLKWLLRKKSYSVFVILGIVLCIWVTFKLRKQWRGNDHGNLLCKTLRLATGYALFNECHKKRDFWKKSSEKFGNALPLGCIYQSSNYDLADEKRNVKAVVSFQWQGDKCH